MISFSGEDGLSSARRFPESKRSDPAVGTLGELDSAVTAKV